MSKQLLLTLKNFLSPTKITIYAKLPLGGFIVAAENNNNPRDIRLIVINATLKDFD